MSTKTTPAAPAAPAAAPAVPESGETTTNPAAFVASVIDDDARKADLILAIRRRIALGADKTLPPYSAPLFSEEVSESRYRREAHIPADQPLTQDQALEARDSKYRKGFDHNTVNNYKQGGDLIRSARLVIDAGTAAAAMPLVSGKKPLTRTAREAFVETIKEVTDEGERRSLFIRRAESTAATLRGKAAESIKKEEERKAAAAAAAAAAAPVDKVKALLTEALADKVTEAAAGDAAAWATVRAFVADLLTGATPAPAPAPRPGQTVTVPAAAA